MTATSSKLRLWRPCPRRWPQLMQRPRPLRPSSPQPRPPLCPRLHRLCPHRPQPRRLYPQSRAAAAAPTDPAKYEPPPTLPKARPSVGAGFHPRWITPDPERNSGRPRPHHYRTTTFDKPLPVPTLECRRRTTFLRA
jgi:hypothetical protein